MHVLMRVQAVGQGRKGGDWQGMRGSGVLGSIDKALSDNRKKSRERGRESSG